MKPTIWALSAGLLISGCGSSENTETPTPTGTATTTTPTPTGTATSTPEGTPTPSGAAVATVDPTLFLSGGFASGYTVTEEACTLSGGTQTTCYRITVTSRPVDHEMGPWCPPNISSDASEGGIWVDDDVIFDVDGAFVENLATFYGDSAWQLYDPETGDINITDTYESCDGAARPDVEEQYQNHCVQCDPDYLEVDALQSFVIPKVPIWSETPADPGFDAQLGVAFNGVEFAQPAPLDDILAAHTIAPFDDCGGHVNLHNGYHYHRATGCSTEVEGSAAHSPHIGYALDGYGIYALLDGAGAEPSDLDECRGHSDDERGYHYHVAGADEPYFIGCFHGETGCSTTFEGDLGATCDATQTSDGPGGPGGPGGPPPGKLLAN